MTMMEIAEKAEKAVEFNNIFRDPDAKEAYWKNYDRYKKFVDERHEELVDLIKGFADHICNDSRSRLAEIRCDERTTPFGTKTIVTVYLTSGRIEQFDLGMTHPENIKKLISIVY